MLPEPKRKILCLSLIFSYEHIIFLFQLNELLIIKFQQFIVNIYEYLAFGNAILIDDVVIFFYVFLICKNHKKL